LIPCSYKTAKQEIPFVLGTWEKQHYLCQIDFLQI
jgi:hypothetical protein